MGAIELLILLCIASKGGVSTAETLTASSITGSSLVPSGIAIEVFPQDSSFAEASIDLLSSNPSEDFFERSSLEHAHRPTINPEYAAKDCTNWVNPTEHSDIPSGFARIPAVISVSNVAINDSFSLAIVDKYGEQLACFKVNAQYAKPVVSVFLGQCDATEPIHEEVWPHLLEPNHDNWPCLVKPHFPLSDSFHIEVGALENEHGTTKVSFRPNGEMQKALSVTMNSTAEFVYIFATTIKTAVNMVYFRDGYTASKCETFDEPITWNQTAYFLPEEGASEVKIYTSFCHTTEVLTYTVDPQKRYWHKLSFGEDSTVDSQENIYLYRNVLINNKIIGNITSIIKPPTLFIDLKRICPLQLARVSITNAIWTNRCVVSDIVKRKHLLADTSSADLKEQSLSCKDLSSSDTSDTLSPSTLRPTINPEYVAKGCSNWINPLEYSDIPSAFTRMNSVISVSGVSANDSFRLAIVDKYGDQLACFQASGQYPEPHVSVSCGKCDPKGAIIEEAWPHLLKPNHDHWPCLVKPHFLLFDYFHIEVSAEENKRDNGTTEVSFRPNGKSKNALSVTVDSSAEFVYIYATKIKTAVNMVYFRDGYTASKCQTLDEPISWNQPAYFLPEEEATQVKIYISYCHFTEVLTYIVTPEESHWHKLSFSEDPSVDDQENIFFYRNILVDDLIVGNITNTVDHPPLLLRLMRVCPLKYAKVSMTNAIWTNKCNPNDMA